MTLFFERQGIFPLKITLTPSIFVNNGAQRPNTNFNKNTNIIIGLGFDWMLPDKGFGIMRAKVFQYCFLRYILPVCRSFQKKFNWLVCSLQKSKALTVTPCLSKVMPDKVLLNLLSIQPTFWWDFWHDKMYCSYSMRYFHCRTSCWFFQTEMECDGKNYEPPL